MADRDVVLGGIWADGAPDPPETPIEEITYADSALDETTINAGWPYSTVVNSASFNEFMRRASSLITLSEKWGILPWCATTVYDEGGLALGSDLLIYQANQSTTGHDPITDNEVHWIPYLRRTADIAESILISDSTTTSKTKVTSSLSIDFTPVDGSNRRLITANLIIDMVDPDTNNIRGRFYLEYYNGSSWVELAMSQAGIAIPVNGVYLWTIVPITFLHTAVDPTPQYRISFYVVTNNTGEYVSILAGSKLMVQEALT